MPYLDKMLEAETPDLVRALSAQRGAFRHQLRVIEAGYPLLVEKPLVFDLEEADRLLGEAEPAPVLRNQLQPSLRTPGATGA